MKNKIKEKRMWVLALVVLFAAVACELKPAITPDQVNAEFAKAKASYDEMMKYNPPETMTYNYRNLMTQAEQAKAKGDLKKAINLAQQAGDQAVLTIQLLKDRATKTRERLDLARDQIELMFPVNPNLIHRYWQLDYRFKSRDFNGLDVDVENFLKDIERERKMSIIENRTLTVYAPQEYTKQYGDVRLYKEITPEGKLKNIVDTMGNGARVKEVRIKLFSPDLTFYYIQTQTGTEGWMAEKYLIGEEAKF